MQKVQTSSTRRVRRPSKAVEIPPSARQNGLERPSWVLAALAVVGVLALAAHADDSATATDRLVLLDGTSAEGVLERIDADGKLSGQALPEGMELDGLRRVERFIAGGDDRPAEPAAVIDFIDGGQLRLLRFTVDDKQDGHLHHPLAGELVVPIDAMRGVRFGGGKVEPVFSAAMSEKLDEDRIFVKLEGGLEPVRGLIETIDDRNIALQVGDRRRTVPRDRVYGIVFAMVSRPPDLAGQCLLKLADGSSVWGKVQSLADGQLEVRIAGQAEVSIPWEAVQSMDVRSTRMVFLSDLEPLEARHQPLVTLHRPWQRDRSIGGRPLTLGGKSYEKGIGVASRSVLVFRNEGNFDLFAATIGIDAETEGRGDCIFVVQADGREVFQQRMSGKDPPRTIAIDIRGKQRIALIVEPGEDLDLADHADWCDARFVRK